MDLKRFKTNQKLEVEGVWHDLGDDTSVLVARAGNAKYTEELRKRMKKYQTRLEMKDETMESVAERVLTECMAEFILLDWKGLKEDGKEVSYSVAKCKEILGNKEYKDFRSLIDILSNDMTAYQENEKKGIVKN